MKGKVIADGPWKGQILEFKKSRHVMDISGGIDWYVTIIDGKEVHAPSNAIEFQ